MKTVITLLCLAMALDLGQSQTLMTGVTSSNVTIKDAGVTSNFTFTVTGYVRKPGVYPLRRRITLIQALGWARTFMYYTDHNVRLYRDPGGFCELGDQYDIQRTGTKEFIVVNINRIVNGWKRDIDMKPGDVVEVREAN